MSDSKEYSCNFKTIARKLNRNQVKEILENANESNEKHISLHIPKFRTDLKAPDVQAERIKSEDDQHILMLKSDLEAMIDDDPELKEYYDGLKTRLNKKKIDEIYTLVAANIPYGNIKRKFKRTPSLRYTKSRHTTFEYMDKSQSFVQEILSEEYENEDFSSDLSITETTESKESQNTFDNSSQLSFDMVDELDEKEKQDDLNLKIAFDMINNDDDTDDDSENEKSTDGIFSSLFKYKNSSDNDEPEIQSEEVIDDEYNGFEYETIKDKEESEKLLKLSIKEARKKLFLSLLLFAGFVFFKILISENDTINNFFSFEKYGIIYILIEIQLIFAALAIHKGVFFDGLKSFLKGKFTSDCVFSATAIFTTLHSVVTIFNQENGINLFGASVILMSTFIGIATYLRTKKNLYCFKVISTDNIKFTADELSPASKEASSFFQYLLEDSDVYTVSKTKFISSFFKRISRKPKSEDILNAIIPAVFFISAIIFAICYFYSKMSIYTSLTALTAFISAAMPATSFFVITIPLVAANKSCKKIGSALIGECVTEDYANASVISFEDIELFPTNKVSMKDLKVYHNMRLDQIIVELARLFDYIGGPLKEFFAASAEGSFVEHDVIKIIESSENGIMIAADGVDYFLGNGEFMRSHGLSYSEDESDAKHEKVGESVMIFAANSVVAAKFYFEYLPQKGFKKLLSHMYKSGLCIGIKTLDPNINNNLLLYHADGSECPISILKSNTPSELKSVCESVDSGIVSNRSLSAFLKAFTLCDKARHSIKSNGIVMLSGSALTAVIMIFLSVTGGIASFTPLHAFLFQTLWSSIIFILSFLK